MQHPHPDAHFIRVDPPHKGEGLGRATWGGIKYGVAGPSVSHTAADAVVHDRELALMLFRLLILLLLLLLGAVTAVETARRRAEQAVMAGIVAGDAADHRALQATLGVGAIGRERDRRNDT